MLFRFHWSLKLLENCVFMTKKPFFESHVAFGEKVEQRNARMSDLEKLKIDRSLQRATLLHKCIHHVLSFNVIVLNFFKVHLDAEINILRTKLKDNVNTLREKEGEKKLTGFDLISISKDEKLIIGN